MASLGKPLIQSALAHFGQLAISLGLVVVVSRLLPPDEIGIYVMAYAVILLVLPLRDFQLQSFVIQRQKIDLVQLQQVAFAAWASSLLAVAICIAGSLGFSLAYEDTRIAECLLIMSAGLLLRPISLPAMAMLARDMRYDVLGWIRLGAALAKVVVTLCMIAWGFGVEALAWGIVAEGAFELAALLAVPRSQRWLRPRAAGSREVLEYCAPFTGAHLVITVTIALTPILIGAYQGLAMTAFFNRGRTVMQFFRSGVEAAVQPIVLSGFAEFQQDRAALRARFLSASALLTGISWPALAWLIAVAYPLTLFLFGPAWIEAAPLTQILAAGAIFYAATALSPQLHAAVGETGLLFRRDGWLQVPFLLLIILAAPVSTKAVAYAFLAHAVLSLIVSFFLLRRSVGLDWRQYIASTWQSGLLAIVTGAVPSVLLAVLGQRFGNAQTLAACVVCGAFAWMMGLVLARHPLLAEAGKLWRLWRAQAAE